MQSGSTPIGFEGIFTDQKRSFIGFEQYEGEHKETIMPAYPLDDVMPSPNQSLRNNYSHCNSPSFVPTTMPSLSHSFDNNIPSSSSSKRSLSFPQLSAIYNEIVNIWSTEQWLLFADDHTETYLTLDNRINEILSVQMAIDQYQLTTGETLLRSLPECLLIRTEPETEILFIPNSIISLENLVDNETAHRLVRYRLMAIVCHSKKTNSKLMFYKHSPLNSWSIYYDRSISSPSHSSILSDNEQQQLESFIQPNNHADSSKFTSPLSALDNHPIIYIYIPEKTNDQN